MTRNDIDADLSAYLDGELDPAEASRVARLIASDQSMARRLAKMSEIKALVSGMTPEVVFVTLPQRSMGRRVLPFMLAGCLSLLIASASWFALEGGAQRVGEAVILEAALQHDRAIEAASAPRPAPATAPAGMFAPEMVAAGLSLAFVRDEVVIDGKAALQAGYVGRYGCRLSLFRIARPDHAQAFDMSSHDGLLHASWSGPTAQFLLIARDMDEARFAVLAGVLKSVSEGGGDKEPEMIASLRVMRQPCVG